MSHIAAVLPRQLKPWVWRTLSDHMQLQYRLPSGIRAQIASYSDWCMYNDIFVAGEYDQAIEVALDKAKPGQTFRVVDLGANVGFFTMRVLDLIARRHIQFDHIECLLVEASVRLRPSLHKHLHDIGRKELTTKIVIGLVGQKTGEAQLVLKASECMNQVVKKSAAKSHSVPYYDLSHTLDEITEISLLKCDIEGSEMDFLENYPQLLRNTQVAVFEFHDPMCPASLGIVKVMEAGFAASHVILDQGNAKTVFFQR
ncbi:MAG: FkbM family methyltransferase [Verrucomicrobiota bacterium]|jgi:FkbM family methyltransferase